MTVIWHADDKQSYRNGPYRICWNTRGWSVWNYDKQKACLGRDLTISEAMKVAESDMQREVGK